MWITRVLLVSFFLHSTVGIATEPVCPEKISEVTRFQELWGKDFSRFPGPVSLESWLTAKLLEQGQLTPNVKQLLEKGHSPLALDSRILDSIAKAYRTLIAMSSLDAGKKTALERALEQAIAALRIEIPGVSEPPVDNNDGGGGGGGGNEGPADEDAFSKDIIAHVKKKGLQRCIVRTAILFFVSNLINTAGALEAKWEKYAGGKGALDGVFDAKIWDAAMADKDFRHNVTWNAILMLALGAFSCLDKNVGKNLMTAVSAATSVAGQYLTSGDVSLRQVFLDALFVRWISVNKSNFVFRLAESYSRRGLPAKHLAEVTFQGLSESLGAYLYPRANDWSKRIWRD